MITRSTHTITYSYRNFNEDEESLPVRSHMQECKNYSLVSLEQAIYPLISIVSSIQYMARRAKECYIATNDFLNEDEWASLTLYTLEWQSTDESLHTILNGTLQKQDRKLLKPWFLYLRLIATALSKIPSISSVITVYRGVKLDLSASHHEGNEVVWRGFSSCTKSPHVLNSERFLGENGTRTKFIIKCFSGKNIQKYSYYSSEHEVLLPPDLRFRVDRNDNHGNGLHVIHLTEIGSQHQLIRNVQPFSSIPRRTITLKFSMSWKSSSRSSVPVTIYDSEQPKHDAEENSFTSTSMARISPSNMIIHRSSTDQVINIPITRQNEFTIVTSL